MMSLIGKYRHLSDEQVTHIEHTVDEKFAYLQQLAQRGATRGPATN
jgi:hypothetical protein